MSQYPPLTFLCVSCEYKGADFIKSCKSEGNKVYLVTSKSLENEAWPREFLDDIFFVDSTEHCVWNMTDVINGLAYFMQSHSVDRIVALDDFDVEKAALMREHFRIPGMGQTTQRYFRDKLAMRIKAQEEGIAVPPFSALFNDQEVNNYTAKYEAPWVVKPRAEASATGIRKIHHVEDLWKLLHELGENRHQYLIEQFKPGDVYHADALSYEGKVKFCRVSRYLDTPFDVAQGGGIFRSQTIPLGSDDDKALQKLNREVMKAFGMQYSASHTEFIKSNETGEFYFLETSCRVGGANLAEMVEAASDINLWSEWAKLETAAAHKAPYQLPKVRKGHSGIIVSLSRFQQPDTSSFNDPEICWRMNKDYHIGLILKSKQPERIRELLDNYVDRVFRDFHASISG